MEFFLDVFSFRKNTRVTKMQYPMNYFNAIPNKIIVKIIGYVTNQNETKNTFLINRKFYNISKSVVLYLALQSRFIGSLLNNRINIFINKLGKFINMRNILLF